MDYLETRRNQFFARLKDICYLDHAGAALYSDDQIEAVGKDLMSHVYGNPHSPNLVSSHCRDSIDQVRNRVLKHFNTNADEYSVIFTSGATAATKLVAENFDWADSSIRNLSTESYLIYPQDNHTSVLGLVELTKDRDVTVKNLTHDEMIGIFQSDDNFFEEDRSKAMANSLFVYSAECNFSGVKYPLEWIEKTHRGVLNKNCVAEGHQRNTKWYCLLDAATFASTNELDLKVYKPDFVTVSFYKIFGFPTGLGALLVRNSSCEVLKKKYFGGGTVKIALSDGSFHELRDLPHERFEDGTVNFLSILSLNHGFSAINRIAGGMGNISRTTFNLTQYTFLRLLKLHHSNGRPAVKLYIDTDYSNYSIQGAIVNFNMLRDSGEYIGFMEVLNLANLHHIQLRTGCFCNPGACQRHLELSNEQMIANYEAGHVCGDSVDLVNGYPTGSVRVSFGYSSTLQDANRLIEMLTHCFVTKPIVEKIPDDWANQLKRLNRCIPRPQLSMQPNSNGLKMKHQKNGFSIVKEIKSSLSTSLADDFKSTKIYSNELKNSQNLYLNRIFLYPIKSCGYLEVDDSWIIERGGLQFDRQWMIVNEDGVPLTQKFEPNLCLVRPRINLKTRKLELSFKDLIQTVSVPLDLEDMKVADDSTKNIITLCQSKVCGDNVTVKDCGTEVAKWLATVLDKENLRLVRLITSHQQNGVAKRKETLSLSNQGQYLLINEASIKWLHELVVKDCSDLTIENLIHRFRCNFVISPSNKPFEELNWTQLNIGKLKFKVDGPCTRCQMICIDQQTGCKTKEVLTTLAAGLKGKIQFGIYLRLIEDSEIENSSVSLNDEISKIKS